MREEIVKLREVMAQKGMDAWIVPSADAHQSEYVGEHDACRKYLSGFTGSAGTLLVLKESAYLWTDGRYFVQAPKELEGSGIQLMKSGELGVPTLKEFLFSNLEPGNTLGFYGRLFGITEGTDYALQFGNRDIHLKTEEDIVDIIWKNRPKRNANPIWKLESGEDLKSKLHRMRIELEKEKVDLGLFCSLSDIAWFTNLRGSDIACNPLFFSYLEIGKEKAKIFLQKDAISKEIEEYLLESGLEIWNYEEWYSYVTNIKGKRIFLDKLDCNYATFEGVKNQNVLVFGISPLSLAKIIKNQIELAYMEEAHIRDGVIMTRFTKWLREQMVLEERIDEVDASDYLDYLRFKDKKLVSLSFDTISGYAENGAVVHYSAKKENAKLLEPKGLYLYDSGGQYLDGTTDVTRTTALGKTTEEERLHYTLVVVSMLRLMNTRFRAGIRGNNLDTIARERLWEYGLDYNHGTGHGVGFCNTVHEGPNNIGFRPNPVFERNVELKEGMVFSDEPGVYIEGKHGIRIENLVYVVPDKIEGFLRFCPLTYAPLDPNPLDISIMKPEEIAMYNHYQEAVYQKLSPYLTKEERVWLKEETRTI